MFKQLLKRNGRIETGAGDEKEVKGMKSNPILLPFNFICLYFDTPDF